MAIWTVTGGAGGPAPSRYTTAELRSGDGLFFFSSTAMRPLTRPCAAPRCQAMQLRPARSAIHRIIEARSEEHTSELQSRLHLVCRLLLEKKKKQKGTP